MGLKFSLILLNIYHMALELVFVITDKAFIFQDEFFLLIIQSLC